MSDENRADLPESDAAHAGQSPDSRPPDGRPALRAGALGLLAGLAAGATASAVDPESVALTVAVALAVLALVTMLARAGSLPPIPRR